MQDQDPDDVQKAIKELEAAGLVVMTNFMSISEKLESDAPAKTSDRQEYIESVKLNEETVERELKRVEALEKARITKRTTK